MSGPATRKRNENAALDLFSGAAKPLPVEARPHAPYQPQSVTSREAAEKIAPVFHGNRRACFLAIAASGEKGTTRKIIADNYFDGKQNYVTGPVALLIEQGLVYEAPSYTDSGAIATREDGSVIPRRIDGSAVLLLTPKGRAIAA